MEHDTNDNKWLAAYLYYSEPWEKLLSDAVLPFIDTMMAIPGVDHYFFIRYWEKGPHIRLRFKGEKQVLEQKVTPAIIHHLKIILKNARLPGKTLRGKIQLLKKKSGSLIIPFNLLITNLKLRAMVD